MADIVAHLTIEAEAVVIRADGTIDGADGVAKED